MVMAMAIPPASVIGALAGILRLPSDQLIPIDTEASTFHPSQAWLAQQEALVAHLPAALLSGRLRVRFLQLAKKMAMAAAGGADSLATKAAQRGIPLDKKLHPRASPTVFCQAHDKIQPETIRGVFYYLTCEVADHADQIRRHPHGECIGRHRDGSKRTCSGDDVAVRDWSFRMMRLSALWCDQHTYSSLHQDSRGDGLWPSEYGVCHLALPCEICVLAAVGAQTQALLDLRASLLSRLKLEAHDRRTRRSRSARGATDTTAAASASTKDEPKRYPHLWPFVEALIDRFNDAQAAAEVRHQSDVLSDALLRVRKCEARRRRHLSHHERQQRKIRKWQEQQQEQRQQEQVQQQICHRCHYYDCRYSEAFSKRPTRMATKYGHRLPLPWLYTSFISCQIKADESLGGSATERPCEDNTAGIPAARKDEQPHTPEWEEAYRHEIFEAKSMVTAVPKRPNDRIYEMGHRMSGSISKDDNASFVTITVHTEAPKASVPVRSSDQVPVPPVPVPPVPSIIPLPAVLPTASFSSLHGIAFREPSSIYSQTTAARDKVGHAQSQHFSRPFPRPVATRGNVFSVPSSRKAHESLTGRAQGARLEGKTRPPAVVTVATATVPAATAVATSTGRKLASPASYVALQADVTASFAEMDADEQGGGGGGDTRTTSPHLHFAKETTHDDNDNDGIDTRTLLPDDSISCVMLHQMERELEQWKQRQQQREREEHNQRQNQRQRQGQSQGQSQGQLQRQIQRQSQSQGSKGKKRSSRHAAGRVTGKTFAASSQQPLPLPFAWRSMLPPYVLATPPSQRRIPHHREITHVLATATATATMIPTPTPASAQIHNPPALPWNLQEPIPGQQLLYAQAPTTQTRASEITAWPAI